MSTATRRPCDSWVGCWCEQQQQNSNYFIFLVLVFSVSSRTRHQNFTNTWSKIISSHKIDRSDLPGHVSRGRKSIGFSTFSEIRCCAHKIQLFYGLGFRMVWIFFLAFPSIPLKTPYSPFIPDWHRKSQVQLRENNTMAHISR